MNISTLKLTQGSKVNYMSGLVFFIELTSLHGVSATHTVKRRRRRVQDGAHLKSASDRLANIQTSFDFFPNLDPSGSVAITCWIAFPTRPVPPVTRTTASICTQRQRRPGIQGVAETTYSVLRQIVDLSLICSAFPRWRLQCGRQFLGDDGS